MVELSLDRREPGRVEVAGIEAAGTIRYDRCSCN